MSFGGVNFRLLAGGLFDGAQAAFRGLTVLSPLGKKHPVFNVWEHKKYESYMLPHSINELWEHAFCFTSSSRSLCLSLTLFDASVLSGPVLTDLVV